MMDRELVFTLLVVVGFLVTLLFSRGLVKFFMGV